MNNTINDRFESLCAYAENAAQDFSQAVIDHFQDSDCRGDFICSMFFMHYITDAMQFPVFLEMMYEVVGCPMPEDLDCFLVSEQQSAAFFSCFMASLLKALVTKLGGGAAWRAM